MAQILGSTGISNVEANAPNQSIVVNEALAVFDMGFGGLRVIDRNLTAPPGSPSEGDLYIPKATATGDWATHELDLAFWINGSWRFISTSDAEDMTLYVIDEDIIIRSNGGAYDDYLPRNVQTGITAATTQTQGQGQLFRPMNHVGTVANTNDVVTLPSALKGLECIVINRGANTLQIFPASGDDIDDAAANASITTATNTTVTLHAIDATSWYTA